MIAANATLTSWGWRRLPRGSGENACETHATVLLEEGRGVATVVNVHLGNLGTQDNHNQVCQLLLVFGAVLLFKRAVVGVVRAVLRFKRGVGGGVWSRASV